MPMSRDPHHHHPTLHAARWAKAILRILKLIGMRQRSIRHNVLHFAIEIFKPNADTETPEQFGVQLTEVHRVGCLKVEADLLAVELVLAVHDLHVEVHPSGHLATLLQRSQLARSNLGVKHFDVFLSSEANDTTRLGLDSVHVDLNTVDTFLAREGAIRLAHAAMNDEATVQTPIALDDHVVSRRYENFGLVLFHALALELYEDNNLGLGVGKRGHVPTLSPARAGTGAASARATGAAATTATVGVRIGGGHMLVLGLRVLRLVVLLERRVGRVGKRSSVRLGRCAVCVVTNRHRRHLVFHCDDGGVVKAAGGLLRGADRHGGVLLQLLKERCESRGDDVRLGVLGEEVRHLEHHGLEVFHLVLRRFGVWSDWRLRLRHRAGLRRGRCACVRGEGRLRRRCWVP